MTAESPEFVNCEESSSKLRGSISFILIYFLCDFVATCTIELANILVPFPLPLTLCPSRLALNFNRYLFSLDFYLTSCSAIWLSACHPKLRFILILNKPILPLNLRVYISFMVLSFILWSIDVDPAINHKYDVRNLAACFMLFRHLFFSSTL